VVQSITNCLGQCGTAGDARELLSQPGVHCLDQRTATLLTYRATVLGSNAADIGLDLIKRSDPLQRLLGQGRLVGDVNVVEFASHMRPAKGDLWTIVCFAGHQATKPGITVDLEQAAEPLQVRLRMLAFAVLTIDIGSGRMAGPTPGPIVDGIAPVSSVTFVQLAFKLTERAAPPGATSVALVPRAPAVDMCPGGRPRRMPNRKLRLRAPVQVPAGVVVARVTSGGRS
jgi:hypothetical protein